MGERTTHYYGDDCNPPHEPTSLTDRLLAALDAEQQIAEAATPGPWSEAQRQGGHWGVNGVRGGMLHSVVWALGDRRNETDDALHIAYQNPARTLRRIAALRRIVERHEHHTFPCADLLDIADALGVEP